MVKLLNIIIALCIVLGVSAHRRNVDNFVGRSGQMIVELPEENIHDDSAILFKGDYFNNMDMESMKDVQFMDLFAQVAGIPTANAEGSHEGFPSSSVFSKPMASLIVSIAGAGAESLEQSKDLPLFEGIKEIPITASSYPLNTHAVLNTMATGTSPSVHGIVGRTWTEHGQKITAHQKGAQAVSSNIADILLQQYNGQSLVVSASAAHSYSSIFAAHSTIARNGWNAHAYSLTDKFHFLSNYPHPHPVQQVFALQHNQMQSILTGAGFSALFSTSYSSPLMTFNGVSFNLQTKADSKLFAELAFVYNLIEKLDSEEVSKLVKDDVPDLFAITFSGLKRIASKYGEGSQQYASALHLINKAATALSDAIDAAYANKTASFFAFINPHHSIPSEIKQSAYTLSKADMSMQEFEKNFPAIYASSSTGSKHERDVKCVNLQRDLGLPVHCFSTINPAYSFYYAAGNGSSGNNTGNNTIYNNRQAFKDTRYLLSFWILFFMSIILISFVLWGVYNLTFVGGDASRDSLLYRVSSRHHHQL